MGGLLPVATSNNKGVLSTDLYKTTYLSVTISSGKALKICGASMDSYLCSINVFGVSAMFAISSTNASVLNVRAAVIGVTSLTQSHYGIYRDSDGSLYAKTTQTSSWSFNILRATSPNNIIMQEVDVDVSSMTRLI